ncbi:MAG: PD40 domain-containing protein [Tildeniella nuda ZEHNDER 1965/U140]|jgi:WD40 repeat protein|nr:PD40 domain-containing protein [Tildeniella nuda ZEHNDER 1965/U140]
MSDLPSQALIVHNQSELEDLAWELESAEGQFSLMLARCNYARLRDELVEHLRQICFVVIRVMVLQPSETALYTRIQSELKGEQPGALMVFGLETVADLAQLLSNANQVREEFRKNCSFPIVLWVTDDVMKGLVHAAPDLESWSTKTHFTLPLEALTRSLKQAADHLFTTLLAPVAHTSFDAWRQTLDLGFLQPSEVRSAMQDLQLQGETLDLSLQASLDFAKGLNATNLTEALVFFEQSLRFWQEEEKRGEDELPSLKVGLLLMHIGRAKVAIAETASQQPPDWEPIRQTLQQAIARFEQADRLDLVALCIPQLERVLQKLQAWNELESAARKGLELHKVYRNQTRLSQDYGFLARALLERQQWAAAREAANQALTELAGEPDDRNWLRGLYRLFLAQAEQQLRDPKTAIAHLEEANARDVSDRGYPKIAIQILRKLRELHFEQKDYVEAFQAKQERLSIEQQYGIRAFVGAGRLRPQRQAVVTEFQAPTEGMVAPEIAAAGRQRDLERLIERVELREYRLIVIHGSSGVGKSSLVNAGLIPALQKPIAARDNVPIVMRVYTQWVNELERLLSERLGDQAAADIQTLESSIQTLLAQLRQLDQRNLRTVLIFDQFEEFFFTYPKPEDRKPFFDFLVKCLQILSIKVFLSLREDYLHLLLEFNRLLATVKEPKTGIDVLSRNVLYSLGNFSLEDTRAIIHSLTNRAHFYLEPALVDQLVVDLAGDLGEVRPIELQVVGAQLQADMVTTLPQYQALGSKPKETLVDRYLSEVIADCGAENQQLAELVLYLLTDEKDTRPLKTRVELEKELQVLEVLAETTTSLDLVLTIIVKSGLVVLLPEAPQDRYQLVHDYLAAFIRQKQKADLVEALKRSKEELNQVLKRKLRDSRIAGGIMGVLTVLAIGLGIKFAFNAADAKLDALAQSSGSLFNANRNFDALIISIKAGKQLKGSLDVNPDTRMKVITSLQQAIHGVKELNSLEGHGSGVSSISISPNGKTIASIGKDNTIKLWSSDGKELRTLQQGKDNKNSRFSGIQFSPDGQLLAAADKENTIALWELSGERRRLFKGHTEWVYGLSFSPDGKMLASASVDKTIKLWSINNGKELKTLRGHTDAVTDVSFSPDGKTIASASDDKTIKLWSLDGKEQRTLKSHTFGIVTVRFSPNSKLLVSASHDKTIKLWSLDGKEPQTFSGHSQAVQAAIFSPDGRTIASTSADKTIKLWNLFGEELQTFKGHSDQINDIVFSPDAKTIISASDDRAIKQWTVDSKNFYPIRGHTDIVSSANLSPDGTTIASGSRDGTMKLWKVSGKGLKTFGGYDGWINGISFSPDGKTIAVGSSDNSIKLWNLDGKELKTLTGHTGSVWGVSFSPDGSLIASASADKTVKLWNLNGDMLKTFKGHTDVILGVSFSPDGSLIASASADKTVKLWNLDGDLLTTFKGHTDALHSASFSPDGKLLVSGSSDKTVRLWTVDGSLKWLKTIEFDDWITTARFSPDGKSIIAACGNGTIRLFSLDGKVIHTFRGHSSDGVLSANFSSDGQTLVSGGDDHLVKLWKLNGVLLQTFPEQKYRRHTAVNRASFSPDGRTIASAGEDSTIKLWNLERKELQTLRGHSDSITAVSFSPDGALLASASRDGTIKLWDAQGKVLQTLVGHDDVVYDVSFSPNGKLIASASGDKTIKLWNLDGKNLQTFVEADEVYGISFSPDSKLIASASRDRTVKLRNLDGIVIHTMSKHSSWVSQVSFSPDGKLIASASWDNTVKLWDLNGRELRTLKGHSSNVSSAYFSPDGKKLISSSSDGTVKFWSIDGTLLQSISDSETVNSTLSALDARLSPDGLTIAVATDSDGLVLWNMSLDTLLVEACTKARAYLRTSSNLEKSDRTLCDDVSTQK